MGDHEGRWPGFYAKSAPGTPRSAEGIIENLAAVA